MRLKQAKAGYSLQGQDSRVGEDRGYGLDLRRVGARTCLKPRSLSWGPPPAPRLLPALETAPNSQEVIRPRNMVYARRVQWNCDTRAGIGPTDPATRPQAHQPCGAKLPGTNPPEHPKGRAVPSDQSAQPQPPAKTQRHN